MGPVHPPLTPVTRHHDVRLDVVSATEGARGEAVTGAACRVVLLPGTVDTRVFGAAVVAECAPEEGEEVENVARG